VPPARGRGDRVLAEDPANQSADSVLDLEGLEGELAELRERYSSAKPFPHIVIDDFLGPEAAKRSTEEFPPVDPELWINWVHVNERKYGNRDPETWGPTLRAVATELNSPRFVDFLGALTGIDSLLVDESMEGGGLHQSLPGGFLNIHADFTVHPHHRRWRRRVNLLLYFNGEWPADYGGELEFWSADMKRRERMIAPVGNRVVIFNTDPDAFHGHPEPLCCPPGTSRQSMAFYYFTAEKDPLVRSTEYRARPGDGWRALPIYLDKQALRTYDWLKRRLGLSDSAASGFLRRLERFGRRWKR
jgi:2OG-Fe(II) oxygenase superfamily